MENKNYYIDGGKSGKVMGGIVLLVIGGILTARQMGAVFPEWLFTWEMLLIAIGVFTGAKHRFRGFGWLVPVFIGGIFLVDNFIPEINIGSFIWPSFIILAGLIMIFGKHHKHRHAWNRRRLEKLERCKNDARYQRYFDENRIFDSENYIDSVSIFGGVKKSIVSKEFKGGEITNIFGGAEINFMQADFSGKIELEITQVFGGTKIIVPSNWTVKSEINPIMGGTEDNRNIQESLQDPEKLIVLKGTTVFGGIEINSY